MSPIQSDTLLLVDGHALIYRAYHAFPGLTDPSGRLVNAVFGFTKILLSAIERFEPKYLAVAFDHPHKTFRHESFDAYKAHRSEMPDDLKPQIEIIKEVVSKLNIPQFEKSGFEADDILGTIVTQTQKLAETDGLELVITTGDKDILQLVNDYTTVWIPARGKFGKDIEYTSGLVKDKMGVSPKQITDLKALMGDSSDNIPGVKGVGKKTATKLIQEFESIEQLYEQVDILAESGEETAILKGALLKKLINDKQSAFQSKELATIFREVPLKFNLEKCKVSGYNKQEVTDLFEELNFRSLIKKLPIDDFELGLQSALL